MILEAGVGATAWEISLHWLLDASQVGGSSHGPRAMLSAGFAGGLRPGLRTGDLVLANEVVDTRGGCWSTTWPTEAPLARCPALHVGRLLTTPTLVGNPEAKRHLGVQYDALAVDMETATLASWCQQHQVPFGALRVICDEQPQSLSPALFRILDGGRVRIWSLLWELLRTPRLLAELLRLQKDSRLAARQLGWGLGEVLKPHLRVQER